MKIREIAALGAVAVFAFSSSSPLLAQEEPEAAPAAAAAEDDDDLEKVKLPKDSMAYYDVMRCIGLAGKVEVLRPRTDKWIAAEVDKYYPLGSVVRAVKVDSTANAGSTATFDFGKLATVTISGGSEFSTLEAKVGETSSRTLLLRKGRVDVKLPRQLKNGEFSVAAPHFVCENMSGESWFSYDSTADGDEAVVHLTTGLMSVKGAHYDIAQLRAGDQLRIATEGDDLFTLVTGESGVYNIVLDQGIRRDKDPLTGAVSDHKESYKFELSPKSAVKIWRRKASVSGRMVVSTMALDGAGNIKSRRAFAENRFEVNSGELVVSAHDAEAAKEAAKQSQDAETTETISVETAEEEDASAPSASSASADDLF